MALLHNATISPTKLELLSAWLPGQPWAAGLDARKLSQVGAYRFDDPDGEVGLEVLLVRAGDTVLQAPLTYRGAPRDGGDLVSTMTHSVLGDRWIYDGCGDPAWVRMLVTTVLTGGHEAPLQYDSGHGIETREPSVRVSGSGTPPAVLPPFDTVTAQSNPTATVVQAGPLTVTVARRLDTELDATGGHTLEGTWPGQDGPLVLATVR